LIKNKSKKKNKNLETIDMFEEEVFEITDFTTSSDWERFISNLEEIISHWNLSGKESEKYLNSVNSKLFTNGKWIEKYESIKFGKILFTIVYHYLEECETNVRHHYQRLDCKHSLISFTFNL
jgi:hypothetical protein